MFKGERGSGAAENSIPTLFTAVECCSKSREVLEITMGEYMYVYVYPVVTAYLLDPLSMPPKAPGGLPWSSQSSGVTLDLHIVQAFVLHFAVIIHT